MTTAPNSYAWKLFVIAVTARQSALLNRKSLGDDSTYACPDGLWCDQTSRLWIKIDLGRSRPRWQNDVRQRPASGRLCPDQDYATGTFGSGFPERNGTIPRLAAPKINRKDGGVIGT